MTHLSPERVEVLGVDHIYLTVSDLAAAEKFYDTVLGLLDFRKSDTAIGNDPHRHYFNRVTQISLRPSRRDTAYDPYAPGLHHLCLQVADNTSIDSVYGLLRTAGIAVSAPQLYPQYAEDYYAIFLDDPDGLRLEVVARRARRRFIAERWAEFNSFLNPVAKLKD